MKNKLRCFFKGHDFKIIELQTGVLITPYWALEQCTQCGNTRYTWITG